ncbi:YggT family protein [Thiohalorhabdus sp.]|uniref:YggT family protein n=1 Tax=Thiohalorhabdus sp. TaxID=3094134 RepID=UPI002FC3A212
MALFGNFLDALIFLISAVLRLAFWIVLIRVLMSWVSPDPANPLVRALYQVTDPILRPAQRLIPPIGGLDLSPIVVLLAIEFLRIFLVGSLQQLTHGM